MSRGSWENKLSSLPCAPLAIFMILTLTHALPVQLDALSAKAAPSVLSARQAILSRQTTPVCPAQLDALSAKTAPSVLSARLTILLKTIPVCLFQPMCPFKTMLERKKPFSRSFLSACYKTVAYPLSTGFRAGGRRYPSSASLSTSTSSGSTSTTRGTTGS